MQALGLQEYGPLHFLAVGRKRCTQALKQGLDCGIKSMCKYLSSDRFKLLQCGQHKHCSLSHTRLGLTDDVHAKDCLRNALVLNYKQTNEQCQSALNAFNNTQQQFHTLPLHSSPIMTSNVTSVTVSPRSKAQLRTHFLPVCGAPW